MLSNLPTINEKVTANSQLVLQLYLRNLSQENILFRPTIEDWVVDNNIIISSINTIDPFYSFLEPQGKIIQTITIEIPSNLSSGQTLKNWLRFTSIQEEAILINLEIISPSNIDQSSQNKEIYLSFDLPYSPTISNISTNPQNRNANCIFTLMSGIIDLDKIPSRWLVAELCIKLCQVGQKYGETKEGLQLLKDLKSSIFFNNGVTIFSKAKVSQWITETIININQTLSSSTGEGYLLYIWESWLFSLVEIDLEGNKNNNCYPIAKFFVEDTITEIKTSPQNLFSGIILGLASLSNNIKDNLKKIVVSNQNNSSFNHDNNKLIGNLITLLLGFEPITVRWLIVEIILIVAQIGDEYSQTKEGKNLIFSLNNTHFSNNGVIAFTEAKIPRWLDISKSAITAYYHSLGNDNNSNGLLNLWETWLWSLVPNKLDINSLNSKSNILNQTTEIFVKDLGMDPQRWFISIVLGLAKISPRIYTQLTQICNQKSNILYQNIIKDLKYNDIFSEKGSIQR